MAGLAVVQQYLWERKRIIMALILIYLGLAFIYQYHYESLSGFIPSLHRKATATTENFEEARDFRRTLVHLLGRNKSYSKSPEYVHVHLEDVKLGHTGEVDGEHAESQVISVAIGGGLTSKKLTDVTVDNIPKKFQLFFTLLPSFCKTASTGFAYHFYLAFDDTDQFFSDKKMLAAFVRHFKVASECADFKQPVELHLVQCSHHAKPAWAQNDAMMEAYLDGISYYYRINDDSQIITADWTNAFLAVLNHYNPVNVGVVGPNHKGGNTAILTYDFVHKTHLEIFGFYYPRLFTDWYADDWVTKVYIPDHSTKLKKINLVHTMKLGQRYRVDWKVSKQVAGRIEEDKKTLHRYLQYKTDYPTAPPSDSKKIVSMCLYGNNPIYTMGAIRNAQLLPVIYPGWTLRVYVPHSNSTNQSLLVPIRILRKLEALGVQLAVVEADVTVIEPRYWSYLVVDDEDVDVFLVRHAHSRLSDREAAAVSHWLDNWQPFHCMRDHPLHTLHSIVDGLWGGRGAQLRPILGLPMSVLLSDGPVVRSGKLHTHPPHSILQTPSTTAKDFLMDTVWALVKPYSYCHDSVSCMSWEPSHRFPVKQRDSHAFYVGERYNQYQEVAEAKLREAIKAPVQACLGRDTPISTRPDYISLPDHTSDYLESKHATDQNSMTIPPKNIVLTTINVTSQLPVKHIAIHPAKDGMTK